MALSDLRAEGVAAATPDEVRRRPITGAAMLAEMTEAGVDAEQLDALRAQVEAAQAAVERLDELIATYEAETKIEGEKVRELGGLVVIGTERHESRRIDNQLRGRSGRQGDPGESRFYISLEDDLMRLFATGLMERVMGAALPDDVPIESRMVSKAVERAQTTVEQKNGEIRKNVLKYDEVMNEQRKVVYGRRDQILGQGDLRADYLAALADVVDNLVTTYCASTIPDEWDRHKLLTEANTFWPSRLTVEDIADIVSTDELYDRLAGEATAHYEQREAQLSPELMREIERRVLLSLIDQRWRDHLYEMDYLREGIGLRAMGQRDPLTEWQREGFDMFAQMMQSVNEDFVRLIMHADVRVEPPAQAAAPQLKPQPFPLLDAKRADAAAKQDAAAAPTTERPQDASTAQAPALPTPVAPAVTNVSYSSSGTDLDEDNATPALSVPRKSAGRTAVGPAARPGRGRAGSAPAPANAPLRVPDSERVGRNDPCPCGSGRKYKNCFGTANCKLSGTSGVTTSGKADG